MRIMCRLRYYYVNKLVIRLKNRAQVMYKLPSKEKPSPAITAREGFFTGLFRALRKILVLNNYFTCCYTFCSYNAYVVNTIHQGRNVKFYSVFFDIVQVSG